MDKYCECLQMIISDIGNGKRCEERHRDSSWVERYKVMRRWEGAQYLVKDRVGTEGRERERVLPEEGGTKRKLENDGV